MTCDEFQRFFSSPDFDAFAQSRGLRAALIGHLVNCRDCAAKNDAAANAAAQKNPEKAEVARAEARAVYADDKRDPEYREVIGLPPA